MKIDANDPKWTAYALGEIEDAQEKAELERILEESPEMRKLVEEIRSTGDLLSRQLNAEPAINLTETQRSSIEERTAAGRRWFGLRPQWVLAASAAAACLLISILAVKQLRSPDQQLPQIAEMIAPAASKEKTSALPMTAAEPTQPAPATVMQSPKGKAPRVAAEPSVAGMHAPASIAAQTAQPLAPPPSEQNRIEAEISGIVTDVSGVVLPGATVKVKDTSTGAEVQTKTDRTGMYRFSNLQPGLHSLTARLPGFQEKTYTDIPLRAAADTRLNLSMEIIKLENTIEVTTPGNMMFESASAAGSPVRELPKQDSKTLDLIGVMSGVNRAPAAIAGGVVAGQLMGHMPAPAPPPLHPDRRLFGRRYNTETYDRINDNPFMDVTQNPLSTFSIDVDTASYSNMRRFLEAGQLPPKDSIRIEELVNYFDYDYKGPKDDKPFAAHFEITEAPWNPEHRLLRIGIKGREMAPGKRPDSNLVFLLDKSGSMQDQNKLPLVKESMRLLVNQLTEADRVAIVVYATDAWLWLPSTSGDQKQKILSAIERLTASGTTNGASGIQLAYQSAQDNFIRGGTNRVILATDGDFNVGITNRGDLTRLIEEKAKSGIFLSALGFGMGNLKDATLEMLAKHGHGNYAYIDTLNEARKVLVDQINATLVPIAKDVKIQVEFNPRHISSYRLIGYEDRLMAKEDFNDDTKDAGVIGAGHAVTALYELVPSGIPLPNQGVDPLKYQKPVLQPASTGSDELLTVKIRSKEPEKDRSVLSEFAVKRSPGKFSEASRDFKFAAAAAAYGMVLRDSQYKGSADLNRVLEWAAEGKGEDRYGYRQEFIRLVRRTISLSF